MRNGILDVAIGAAWDPTTPEKIASAGCFSTLNIYLRVSGKAVSKLEQLRGQCDLQGVVDGAAESLVENEECVGQSGTLGGLYDTAIRLSQELHSQAGAIREEALASKRLLRESDCEPLKPLARQCSVSLTLIGQYRPGSQRRSTPSLSTTHHLVMTKKGA